MIPPEAHDAARPGSARSCSATAYARRRRSRAASRPPIPPPVSIASHRVSAAGLPTMPLQYATGGFSFGKSLSRSFGGGLLAIRGLSAARDRRPVLAGRAACDRERVNATFEGIPYSALLRGPPP